MDGHHGEHMDHAPSLVEVVLCLGLVIVTILLLLMAVHIVPVPDHRQLPVTRTTVQVRIFVLICINA